MPCEICKSERVRSRGAGMLCMTEGCPNYGKNQEGVTFIEDTVLTGDEVNRMHEIERLSEGKDIIKASGMKVVEENTLVSYLAVFIDFVEEESKRIDEERCGLHRKDGGRKLQCSIFLTRFIKQLLQKQREQMVEEIEKNKKDIEIIKNAPFNPALVIQKNIEQSNREGYNEALSDIINLITK